MLSSVARILKASQPAMCDHLLLSNEQEGNGGITASAGTSRLRPALSDPHWQMQLGVGIRFEWFRRFGFLLVKNVLVFDGGW